MNGMAVLSLPRRTSMMSSNAIGLFRSTRPMLIPAQLTKFLVTATAILIESLYKVYQKESMKPSQKMKSEKERIDYSSSYFSPRDTHVTMTESEAIQVLGLEVVNPRLLEDARISKHSLLPLSHPRDREVAKKNFDRMFSIAVKHNNMYLAGKLSAAYKLCIDPNWDNEEENAKK